MQWSKFSSR